MSLEAIQVVSVPVSVQAVAKRFYVELLQGVEFTGPIQEAPWGRFATFSDPDGNGWVLQQNT